MERIRALLPESELEPFFAGQAARLRKSIRVNTLRVSIEKFRELAVSQGWELTPVPWCPTGFFIDREDRSVPLGRSWMHAAGLFYIQEASSMLPPELLAPESGELVLDMAAAPGSKSTQLAAIMQNAGTLVANEPQMSRIKSLVFNLEQAAVANIATAKKDGGEFGNWLPNTFDRVLLDAPCTGEGTARKDETVWQRWSEKSIEKIVRTQQKLIFSAFQSLAPGGRLVYSTCTFAPEENEGVVDWLLQRVGDAAEIVPLPQANGIDEFENLKYDPRVRLARRLWPHRDGSEGFFACCIQKNYPTEARRARPTRFATDRFIPFSADQARQFGNRFREQFGQELILPAGQQIFRRKDELWLKEPRAASLAARFPFERVGSKIGRTLPDGRVIWSQLGGLILLSDPTRQQLDLTESQLDEIMAGRDISAENTGLADGQIALRHRGFFIAFGLLKSGSIKNQLPREFVILPKK